MHQRGCLGERTCRLSCRSMSDVKMPKSRLINIDSTDVLFYCRQCLRNQIARSEKEDQILAKEYVGEEDKGSEVVGDNQAPVSHS